MGVIIFGLVGIAFLLFVLALFARGGPHETFRAAPSASGPRSLHELQVDVGRLLNEMGFLVDEAERRTDPRRSDWVARDPRPVVGQSMYARLLAPGTPPASAAEVQAALDAARG